MAYEVKCSNCDRVITFGGRENLKRLPDNAMRFDDEVYCEKCVRKLVKFGSGDIMSRVRKIEDALQDMSYELGMEFEKGD